MRAETILVLIFLEAIVVGAYVATFDVGSEARRDALNRMCWTYGNATGNAEDVWSGDKYYVVLCDEDPAFRKMVENVTRSGEWKIVSQ